MWVATRIAIQAPLGNVHSKGPAAVELRVRDEAMDGISTHLTTLDYYSLSMYRLRLRFEGEDACVAPSQRYSAGTLKSEM